MHTGFAHHQEKENTTSQPAQEDVSTIFNSVFNVELAMSPEAINEVFEVRYQVYCIDRHFEDPDCFADKREHDEYDRRTRSDPTPDNERQRRDRPPGYGGR